MRANTMSGLKGFVIKSAPPERNPLVSSITSLSAVMKITGIFCVNGFAFTALQTSKPSMPGMITSSNIRSGGAS